MTKIKSEDCERLGTRIRELRVDRGYSQEAFADHIGLHRTYLGGLERGERNPTFTVIRKIAVSLELTLSELLFGL